MEEFELSGDPYLPKHTVDDFVGEDKPIKCPPNPDIPAENCCPYLHCTKCTYALLRAANSYVCFKCDAIYFLKGG